MSARPGPRNSITDVDGIAVGQAHDERVRSGVTVVLADGGAVPGGDVRGGAPGTRETALLAAENMVQRADAVVLSGGSAFGLDAAGGVMAWLAARGRGFAINGTIVPIVPAAILFDLANGGDKAWGEAPPYRALGRAACEAAGADVALGNAGAGFGALAGRLKGGLGTASALTDDGWQVGAIVAANPVGSVVDHRTGAFWAQTGAFGGELGAHRPFRDGPDDLDLPPDMKGAPIGASTTIAVVATNAMLTKAEANRLAIMAHDGFARAIRPVHTPLDGDTIFTLATGRKELGELRPRVLARLGHLAAECVSRAVARGVYHAETLGTHRSWRDAHGD